jgi:hypothetical protein
MKHIEANQRIILPKHSMGTHGTHVLETGRELIHAAGAGRRDEVLELLRPGVSGFPEEAVEEALRRSIQLGYADISLSLLRTGFNPNRNKSRSQLLIDAAQGGDPEVVKAILYHATPPPVPIVRLALKTALYVGRDAATNLLKQWLDHRRPKKGKVPTLKPA